MKILITGANGQLGRELAKQYKKQVNIDLILTDSSSLDITKAKEVYSFVNIIKPDVIINCAAYTFVDKCESEIDLAYRVNTIGPKNLATAANEIGAAIVHISTDYVFAGTEHKHLTEFDNINPQTIYGKTKLQGEILVAKHNPKHYILRTAWLYGDGNNFVRTMLNLSKINTEIKVVNDQWGTPTSTVDVARVIMKLVEEKNYGLFHCTCRGECTWYELTKEIFRLKGINTKVLPCSTEEFKRPAKRPNFSVLRNYMLELTCSDITRDWQEALDDYLK